MSTFTKFGYVTLHSNQAVNCKRSPKFLTNVSNSEMASLNSNFSDFRKPSTRLQSNEKIPNFLLTD